MDLSIAETILIILLTAIVVSSLFRALHLPVILGYLVVGALVGPHVLGWMPDLKDIKDLAEFGVALLLFTIGLEFSFSKLVALRHSVFVLGSLQVISSILITLLAGLMIRMTLIESIVIGCVVAMSSTAIVIKQLSDQFELQSKYGLNAVGILLFQDLAVIPILVLLSSLASNGAEPFSTVITWALLKGILAIVIIIGVGRWLIRPLFHLIASTRVLELFTLSVLFVAIGSAWLTYALGMSYALGAFLAGIMLGETEYRHQINVEIRPFRDVLLALFFVSIGMLVNVTIWIHTWVWILLLLVALMIGKTLLIVLLCRLSKYKMATALRTGVVLSQGGEFGFAILTLAITHKLLPPDYGQVVLAALLITFAFAPIIIRNNKRIVKFLFPKTMQVSLEENEDEIRALADQLSQHVIICGYGRVGQNIARFLTKLKQSYVGLDLDPEIIHSATLAGDSVVYGNATHVEFLKAANLDKAAAIVITFNDVRAAITILNQIRQIKPTLPILVRCKDEAEFEELRDSGATKIVTEIFEESLSIVSHLLKLIHVPHAQITKLLKETRHKNYALLYQVFPGSFTEEKWEEGVLHEYLRPIPLPEKAHAVNLTIEKLGLENVEIIAVRRGNKQLKPNRTLKLLSNDILILSGLPQHLDEAEDKLL